MTPRERLLHFLADEPVDRVPIWLLFPYHPTGYYVNVQTHPAYRTVFEASRDRAVMLNRRNLGTNPFTPEVVITHDTTTERGATVRRTHYRYRGTTLTAERRQGPDGTASKPLLASAEDLEAFVTFPLELDPAALDRQLDAQLPAYLAERDAFPHHYGAMMLDLGEPIGFLYRNSQLEEYALWSLTHADAVQRWLDAAMVQYRHVYRYTLARRLAEVYFLVGSELASPPLVSRATFQRWIVPYAQELIAMVHQAGARAIQHYHGQIGQILPDFLTMGADALHTIEEPPIGNCTLEHAFATVGRRLGLIGCIQYDCFREYTPEQMRAAVRAQLERLRGQRFMLSPSAGPYEEDPSPRVIPNYLAFLDAGWEFGG
jgi:uroporphyrinogen-III decarboxylase